MKLKIGKTFVGSIYLTLESDWVTLYFQGDGSFTPAQTSFLDKEQLLIVLNKPEYRKLYEFASIIDFDKLKGQVTI